MLLGLTNLPSWDRHRDVEHMRRGYQGVPLYRLEVCTSGVLILLLSLGQWMNVTFIEKWHSKLPTFTLIVLIIIRDSTPLLI